MDWNGLNDTALKDGHNVAEVICNRAPCQVLFDRGARAHLAMQNVKSVMFCCSRVDFRGYRPNRASDWLSGLSALAFKS